jgi:hypothetical protein
VPIIHTTFGIPQGLNETTLIGHQVQLIVVITVSLSKI